MLNKKSVLASSFQFGEKLFLGLITTALIWVLIYGIIIKFTIHNQILFEVKTLVPEILLMAACVTAIISRLTGSFKPIRIILLCAICAVMAIGFALDNFSNAAIVVRDVLIPVLAFAVFASMRPSEHFSHSLMHILTIVFLVYVIASIALYAIEAYMGYEWTARFYTGYVFWGQDPISKIAINSNGSAMRLPGLTGASVKSAIGGLAALVVFLSNNRLRGIGKVTACVLALLCIYLFNNRGSLFAAVVILLIAVINHLEKSGSTKLFLGILAVLMLIIAVIVLQQSSGALSLHSAFQRFNNWGELLSSQGFWNIILPSNVYSFSSGGEGLDGVSLSTSWDNAILYLLFGFGLPVALLFIVDIVGSWKETKSIGLNLDLGFGKIIQYSIVATLILGLSTNIFQGRSWYFLFVVIAGISLACISNSSKEGRRLNRASDDSSSKYGLLHRTEVG